MSNNNVIYGFQISYEEPEEALIDSNDLANRLISKAEQAYKDKLLAEERARRLKEMEESGAEIPEGVDPDEFLGLVDTITQNEEPEEPDIDYVAEAMAEAERILADANRQAEEILENARLDGEAMRNLAEQEGKKQGYNEGTQQAAMELQAATMKMDAELNRRRNEYIAAATTMEHDIIEICLPVFEKVFSAELTGRKEVLYHLLDQCIKNIERSSQMQIKVSEANAEYIKSKKNEILAKVGTDVALDIIADSLMGDGECVIETDGGIFDCGIDTELEALIRNIRALC